MTKELIKTPAAPCRWAKVLKSDEGYPAYDESAPNEWSIELLFDTNTPEDMEFLAACEDLYDKHNEGVKKSAYWWPGKAGDGEDAGKTIVRFKTKLRQFKNGWNKGPIVLDKEGRPWPADKEIGNGSVVKVAFDVYAWKTGTGGGMTFQPTHVMVLEHIPYSGGGATKSNPFDSEVPF